MNSDSRGAYYYIVQGLMHLIPMRKLRKKVYYLSFLGSFKNLSEQRKIHHNYENVVKEYKKYQKTRKAKMAFYSCFTGGYDTPPRLTYFDKDCDYILFVDNPEAYDKNKYIWEFRPLQYDASDNVRNARYHKIMVHKVLQEYTETVWMDSNIDFVSTLFSQDLQKVRDAHISFAISAHPDRDCLFAEAKMCQEMGKDKPELIEAECDYIRSQGFPEHYGLYETNIMYRNMSDTTLPGIMEIWWQIVHDFSRRDQLSLMFAVWKNKGTYPQPLNKISYRKLCGDVLVSKHFRKRKKENK